VAGLDLSTVVAHDRTIPLRLKRSPAECRRNGNKSQEPLAAAAAPPCRCTVPEGRVSTQADEGGSLGACYHLDRACHGYKPSSASRTTPSATGDDGGTASYVSAGNEPLHPPRRAFGRGIRSGPRLKSIASSCDGHSCQGPCQRHCDEGGGIFHASTVSFQ